MILFLRFRRATLLLTRGMDRSLRHQQPLEASFVGVRHERGLAQVTLPLRVLLGQDVALVRVVPAQARSEEHTSELQSPYDLVCRLLLDKKTRPGYGCNLNRDKAALTVMWQGPKSHECEPSRQNYGTHAAPTFYVAVADTTCLHANAPTN